MTHEFRDADAALHAADENGPASGQGGGADGGRTHDLRIANAIQESAQPAVTASESHEPAASAASAFSHESAPVGAFTAPKKRRGRPQPDYGELVPCTGCSRKPVYRDGLLQPCVCGGPGNPRWPKTI